MYHLSTLSSDCGAIKLEACTPCWCSNFSSSLPAHPSKYRLQLPVFMKELFHFNDALFCTFVWKACGSESASWCLFCGMGVAVAELDSLCCPCVQEAGGSRARVEYTQHATLLCLRLGMFIIGHMDIVQCCCFGLKVCRSVFMQDTLLSWSSRL